MEDFPKWKPQKRTLQMMHCDDLKLRMQIIRNAASNFISKPEVRKRLFKIKGDRCYICGNKAIQIDHKISAHRFAEDPTLNIAELNSLDNLYPICTKCNASKAP